MVESADFEIYQGETAIIRVQVNEQDGSAKDVSSATVTFYIGDIRGQTSQLEKTGGFESDGNDGVIQVQLTEADTKSLELGLWDYQFFIESVSSSKQVVKEGAIRIKHKLDSPA